MNKNLQLAIKAAIKRLEASDPIEAVSILELALLQPGVDLNTRKTLEKAKDESELGVPATAETLLGMIDLKIGDTVVSFNGIYTGKTTGGSRPCQLEGCRGKCLGVRWNDGKLTFPCTAGMTYDDKTATWKLR